MLGRVGNGKSARQQESGLPSAIRMGVAMGVCRYLCGGTSYSRLGRFGDAAFTHCFFEWRWELGGRLKRLSADQSCGWWRFPFGCPAENRLDHGKNT
jgi:hypothetical protein